MLAQDEKIIRKTFTKRSKKNLLWNEEVTIPCDIFEALPEPFNIHFFSARGKKYVIANVCGFHSVAAAGTDQNKSTKFVRKIGVKSPDYFPRRQKRKAQAQQ